MLNWLVMLREEFSICVCLRHGRKTGFGLSICLDLFFFAILCHKIYFVDFLECLSASELHWGEKYQDTNLKRTAVPLHFPVQHARLLYYIGRWTLLVVVCVEIVCIWNHNRFYPRAVGVIYGWWGGVEDEVWLHVGFSPVKVAVDTCFSRGGSFLLALWLHLLLCV